MVDKVGTHGNSGSAEIGLPCAMGPDTGFSDQATKLAVFGIPKAAFTFQDRDRRACRSVMAGRAGVAIATKILALTWVLPG